MLLIYFVDKTKIVAYNVGDIFRKKSQNYATHRPIYHHETSLSTIMIYLDLHDFDAKPSPKPVHVECRAERNGIDISINVSSTAAVLSIRISTTIPTR